MSHTETRAVGLSPSWWAIQAPSQLREELSGTVHVDRFLWWLPDLQTNNTPVTLLTLKRITMPDDKKKTLTFACFFVSGATDLEILRTSIWTSVKTWLRFSTLSFFTALICEATYQTYMLERKTRNTLVKARLTCLSVVVTGLALFLFFKCLFATWKTFFCFFPFCLFFPMLPEERTTVGFDCSVGGISFLRHSLLLTSQALYSNQKDGCLR